MRLRLGLNWLRANLGCEVDTQEEEQLPGMKCVIVLSDGGEESMWNVEPDVVGQAAQALKAMGELHNQSGWRCAYRVSSTTIDQSLIFLHQDCVLHPLAPGDKMVSPQVIY